jgi:hypothetical protein
MPSSKLSSKRNRNNKKRLRRSARLLKEHHHMKTILNRKMDLKIQRKRRRMKNQVMVTGSRSKSNLNTRR